MGIGTFLSGRNDGADKFLAQRVEQIVVKLGRADSIQTSDVVKSANLLYRLFQPKGNFLSGFMAYVDLFGMLHEVGRKRRLSTQVYALKYAVARLFADGLEMCDDDASPVFRVLQGTRELKSSRDALSREGQYVETALQAAELLRIGYEGRALLLRAVRRMFPGEYPWGIEEGELQAAEQKADLLASQIIKLQRYGIKPCVMQDGLLHRPSEAWVFSDVSDRECGAGMLRPLAVSHLALISEVTSLREKVDDHRVPGARFTSMPFPSLGLVVVQRDGRLTADSEYGLRPLEAIFGQAGREKAYHFFRLLHLMRVADLVVPVEVYREHGVPTWPVMPATRKQREASRQRPEKLLRDLWVPRQLIISRPELLDGAFDAELAEAMRTHGLEPDASSRARHSVPGFTRKLPEGCQATPEARRLALEERGIVLQPGYTYVRHHERGSEEDAASIGHRAIRRPRA